VVPLILSGRADALYVVNDALGSLLLRANEVIDQVPMSACVQVFGCRDAEILPSLGQPASEKRQGRKSRGVGH
jgi:hypothetical protein